VRLRLLSRGKPPSPPGSLRLNLPSLWCITSVREHQTKVNKVRAKRDPEEVGVSPRKELVLPVTKHRAKRVRGVWGDPPWKERPRLISSRVHLSPLSWGGGRPRLPDSLRSNLFHLGVYKVSLRAPDEAEEGSTEPSPGVSGNPQKRRLEAGYFTFT
jgi:hypothetical protein